MFSNGSRGFDLGTTVMDLSEPSCKSRAIESEIISLKVFNPQYPINVPVILKVCDGIADVLRIKIFDNRDKTPVVALVEFRSVFDACKVKDAIDGADIYDNCCTLDVTFSTRRSPLFVELNDEFNWDCRLNARSRGAESSPDLLKRRTLLSLPNEPDRAGDEATRQSRKRDMSPDFNFNKYGVLPSKRQHFPDEEHRAPRDPIKAETGYRGRAARPFFLHMNPPPMNGPPRRRGNVLMLYDLDERLDPGKIFNLFCLYGDVVKIKFLMTKEGCAMVEMTDCYGVGRVLEYLNGCPVFGKKITIKHSWQEAIFGETDPNVRLGNGSPAFQDYRKNRNLRFNNPSVASKNRIVGPTKMLHFFNVPTSVINSKEKMYDHLASHGVSRPVAMSFFPGSLSKVINSGLIQFATLPESVDALIACNNSNIQPSENVKHFSIKLCFSKNQRITPEIQQQNETEQEPK